MRNFFKILYILPLLAACSNISSTDEMVFNPDFNKYARNVSVAYHSDDEVTYEYKNIRVDELGAIAALYCQDHGEKQAWLDKITLQRNNSRLATFICR